jgi:hypothetical protein
MQQKHAGGGGSSNQGWVQDSSSSSSRLVGEAGGSDSDTQPGLDVYDAAAAGGAGGSGRALVFRPHHVAVAVNGKGRKQVGRNSCTR